MTREAANARRMGGALLCLVSGWGTGCVLSDVDLTGRRCGDDLPCAEGWTCHPTDAVCVEGEVTCVLGRDPATCAPKGLVAYYRFDEGDGPSTKDATQGAIGNFRGDATWDEGVFGSAVACSGDGGYLVLDTTEGLADLHETDYSIAIWVKPRSRPPSGDADRIDYALVARQGHHMGLFYDKDGRFVARHVVNDGDGNLRQRASSGQAYEPGEWHHVVGQGSVERGAMRIYVDGALVGQHSFEPALSSFNYGSNWRVGVAAEPDKPFWYPADAVIDELRFYDRWLTEGEIVLLSSGR